MDAQSSASMILIYIPMINTENAKNVEEAEEQSIKVVFFPNLEAIRRKKIVDVSTIIEYIKVNESALQYNKEDLPVVFFSVYDFIGRKEVENVIKHTGLIVIDIDVKENLELDFKSLKNDLKRDDYVFACFTSPSGGIKILLNTTLKELNHHHAYYNGVKSYILKKYPQIKKIDNGSNINRACYLPFDKDIYYNPKSMRFDNPQNLNPDVRNSGNRIKNSFNFKLDAHYSLDEHIDNLLQFPLKVTTVPLYQFLFNNYRYKGIEEGIMSTNVTFLELKILKYAYPHRLDYTTHIDDKYFEDDVNQILHIYKLGAEEGLDYCELVIGEIIKEGFRGKTLFSITVKLLFNNPLCHPYYIFNEVKRINDTYCEDPHPQTNPKPDDSEVQEIVQVVYERFLSGTLDFTQVMRKNKRTSKPMKKKTFKSRLNDILDKTESRNLAISAYVKGEKDKMNEKYHRAIETLQDGLIITQKRIADTIGVSERTVKRYQTSDIKNLIREYNNRLKKSPAMMNENNKAVKPDSNISNNPEVKVNTEVHESSTCNCMESERHIEPTHTDYNSIFHQLYSETINRTDKTRHDLLFEEFKKRYDSLSSENRELIKMREAEIPNDKFWIIHEYKFSFILSTLKRIEEPRMQLV